MSNTSKYPFPSVRVVAKFPGGEYLVASPNQDFIPLPITGRVEVAMREDGRFGQVDPIQWPQVFSPRYPYLSAVPTRSSIPQHKADLLWWSPTLADFQPTGSTSQFGKLQSPKANKLCTIAQELVAYMEGYERSHPDDNTVCSLRLKLIDFVSRLSFPSTFRDLIRQVAAVQRAYLECEGYLKFYNTYAPLLRTHSSMKPANSPKHQVLGAFTQDLIIALRLYTMGIPLWFLCKPSHFDEKAVHVGRWLSIDDITRPTGINELLGPFDALVPWFGWAGDAHITEIGRRVYTMVDVERHVFINGFVPPPKGGSTSSESYSSAMSMLGDWSVHAPSLDEDAATTSSSGPSRTKAKPNKHNPYNRSVENEDRKFNLQVDHPHLPTPAESWRVILASTDLSTVNPPDSPWGYWYPPAAMVLGPVGENSVFRLKNYLRNWFWIREAWFYCMSHRATSFTPITTQRWRDWLQQVATATPVTNQHSSFEKDTTLHRTRTQTTARGKSKASKTAGRKQESYDHFRKIFDPAKYAPPPLDRILWFKNVYDSPPSDVVLKQIGWELNEVSFRVELLHLDATLVKAPDDDTGDYDFIRRELLGKVFPDRHWQRPLDLPQTLEGLAAREVMDRVQSLEALRSLMLRWPDAPASLRLYGALNLNGQNEAVILDMEESIISFYVKSFYSIAGRAPTVPHVFPCS